MTELVTARVSAVARTAALADIDGWFEQALPELTLVVEAGNTASSVITSRYLTAHAATEGALVDAIRAEIDRAQLETSLRVSGPVAYKTNIARSGDELTARRVMTTQLRGAATRLSLLGGRDTTELTLEAAETIVGQRRVTAANPCAFCAMIASRGAVYKSDQSATRVVGRSGSPRGTQQIGQRYHDHCRCTYEPLYVREQEPPEVVALREQWAEVTDGLSGQDAVRAFRKNWDNRTAT